MRSFCYTADTNFSEEFLLHSILVFTSYQNATLIMTYLRGAFVTLLSLVLVRSFLYSPLSEEFLLHS